MNRAQRFDGAAAWAQLDAQAQARIGALTLELICASRTAAACLHPALEHACDDASSALLDRLDQEVEALFGPASPQLAMIPSVFGDWCPRLAQCPQLDICAGGERLVCEGACNVGMPRGIRLDA